MEYKYTQAHESYEMYAAGGVFYSAPGLTAFPVRLAVEIFRRCQAIRAAQGAQGPAVVYDPCCGGAYHLATMAYFNWDQIAGIYGSDIDEDALGVATRNLSLLTLDGMDRRIAELTEPAPTVWESIAWGFAAACRTTPGSPGGNGAASYTHHSTLPCGCD